MKNYFFNEDGMIDLDKVILERGSLKAILEDGVITDEEVKAQGELVVELFQKMEQKLDDDEKELVLDAICEFCVLSSLYNKNIINDVERRFE